MAVESESLLGRRFQPAAPLLVYTISVFMRWQGLFVTRGGCVPGHAPVLVRKAVQTNYIRHRDFIRGRHRPTEVRHLKDGGDHFFAPVQNDGKTDPLDLIYRKFRMLSLILEVLPDRNRRAVRRFCTRKTATEQTFRVNVGVSASELAKKFRPVLP
jgi:hypothetical protein